ncbi:MAG: S1 RNA-binding domain-containing protein [Bacteroidales bacterium]
MMIQPGKLNTLRVVKILDFGVYLDGGEMGEILMPTKWVPGNTKVDDELDVFIYFDSEDRPIATTLKPKAMVGEFALMKVKAVNRIGAFLDWGLDKDLLVPFKEQNAKMEEGRFYLVYLYVDSRSKRIAASAKLEKYLDIEPVSYETGQQVDLVIWTRSDLGYKAIINQKHSGLLYANEIFHDVFPGQQMKGYISEIRPDGKIDLKLQKSGFQNIDQFTSKLLDVLKSNDGFLPLTDKSNPEEIYKVLQMSKKNFKKSVGNLYRQKIISISENGVSLIEE